MNTLRHALDDLLNQTVLLGYDRIGYAIRQPLWDPQETDVDMSGKCCVVTGANSGLGYATAKALAEKGARVMIVCRSAERGAKAQQALIKATGHTDIHLAQVDMSRPEEIRAFAKQLEARNEPLDVLINNAGALFNQRKETPEGFEKTFATNLLGPYLLTRLLIPRLQQAPEGRIINVCSGGMYLGKLHLNDLQFKERSYNGAMAYAEAKRGLMILTQLWAKALAGSSLKINAMHPGWADTPGVAHSLPGFRQLTRWILRSHEEGADTIVWLAVKPRLYTSGALFFDRKTREVHRRDATRSSTSTLEQFWHHLGTLTEGAEPFPS